MLKLSTRSRLFVETFNKIAFIRSSYDRWLPLPTETAACLAQGLQIAFQHTRTARAPSVHTFAMPRHQALALRSPTGSMCSQQSVGRLAARPTQSDQPLQLAVYRLPQTLPRRAAVVLACCLPLIGPGFGPLRYCASCRQKTARVQGAQSKSAQR